MTNTTSTTNTTAGVVQDRPLTRNLGRACSLLSLALILFGDVLAFNQLATQSPTDALLQLVVFAIGGAGVVDCLRRALFPLPTERRFMAIFPGILGAAALLSWRAQLPISTSLVIAVIATLTCGLISFRLLRNASRSHRDYPEVLGLLSFAQTIVFGYVTVLATVDAAPAMFG